MKKILVAFAAAALALSGMTPANATVVSDPVLPAGPVVTGDTLSATLGSYTNETVTGRAWVFCTTAVTKSTLEDSSLLGAAMSNGNCDWLTLVSMGNPETATSFVVPRVVYGNWDRSARLMAGKYVYFVETSGTGPWVRHASNGIQIGSVPATMPSIVTSNNSLDLPVGGSFTLAAGVNIPEVASVFDSGVFFCNYDARPAALSTPWDLYADPRVNAQYCDYLADNTSHNSSPSYPFTVGANFWSASISNRSTPSAGMYLIYYEMYREGYTQTYRGYFSQSVYIGTRAQTVSYDANTGTGAITASVANGARTVADGSGFSRSGYAFAGWNTAANGTGTAVAGGASYTPSGNVTLYAQWTRIPTPPAPVFTSPIAAAPTGGVLNLTGANLSSVTSITIDDLPATISTNASGAVSVKLPTLAPGKYDITIKNADGGIRFIDGLVVPDPNAKVAPKPTNTYVAGTAIKVAGGNVSAKQATALTQFVAQYKTAKQATVFIRTSKAGLPAAKKAAAAMLATVVKTLKNVKTGIVVDSTSETTTALDLVVTD